SFIFPPVSIRVRHLPPPGPTALRLDPVDLGRTNRRERSGTRSIIPSSKSGTAVELEAVAPFQHLRRRCLAQGPHRIARLLLHMAPAKRRPCWSLRQIAK